VGTGVQEKATFGSWGDIGASFGVADWSGCGNQAGKTITIGAGKFYGIQLTLRKEFDPSLSWYNPRKYLDGITGGYGLAVPKASPITVAPDSQFVL
jgi:hypothetical protein